MLELNRNPDNYFAEVEQLAMNRHVVPGRLLSRIACCRERLFSYGDTQLLSSGRQSIIKFRSMRRAARSITTTATARCALTAIAATASPMNPTALARFRNSRTLASRL